MGTLGVIRESEALETRVALVPEVVSEILKDKSRDVLVESGAGIRSGYLDKDYQLAGAKVASSREELIERSDVLIAINGIDIGQKESLAHKVVIGLFDPHFNREHIKAMCKFKATPIALELIPRISRAQSMDALSSQANIAGYVSVILAANKLSKVMPLMMTAAGTIKPAKVLIVGAGVAGLQAIATAKRMGAVVFAYDVRSVVKEQVESLGARFVEIKLDEQGEAQGGYAKALSNEAQSRQRARLADFAKDMDIIITTAQIPGRRAPVLLDDGVFSKMVNESIIIDLASVSGGNVAGSEPNHWKKIERTWLYGADNLSRMVPRDASFTYGKNVQSLLQLLYDEKGVLNIDDEIMREAIVCHEGQWVNKALADSMAQESK